MIERIPVWSGRSLDCHVKKFQYRRQTCGKKLDDIQEHQRVVDLTWAEDGRPFASHWGFLKQLSRVFLFLGLGGIHWQ